MNRTDFVERARKAIADLDPETILTVYLDLDGMEVEYLRPTQPGDHFDSVRADGQSVTMRAIDRDWADCAAD